MPRRRTESGCIGLYMDEYERWLAQELDDADLRPELLSIHLPQTFVPLNLVVSVSSNFLQDTF